MILTPAQAIILKDNHRFRVVRCGRKFGKTTFAAEEIKDCAFAKNDRRVIYIAPTLEDARRLMWDRIKNQFRNCAEKSNDTRLELSIPTQRGGTSTIFLGSWEKIDNYRGDEFDFIVFDETQLYRGFWTGWRDAMRPTLTPRKGAALFLGTPLGFNHLYDLSNLELTDKDFKTFHFTTYDNPYIPLEEIEAAKASLPPNSFGQEYLAEFTKSQGLVYKEFSREKHLYEELPKNKTFDKFGGIDFGYRNPAAVLDARFDGENLYVDDEWYKRERTDIQIAEYVAIQRFKAVYPDPENASGIEELRRKGVNVREVRKGKGSIEAGIQMIREMLIRGNLKINKKCVNLISEFEMYSYDDDKKERNENENPAKANDHALDALRYIVSSLMPIIQRQEFRRALPLIIKQPKPNQAR